MLTIVKYALYAFIAVILYYFGVNLYDNRAAMQDSIQQKTEEVSDMAGQMMQNVADNFAEDMQNDVSEAYNNIEENVTQIIKE